MQVTYVNHMGDDLTVVNAARVSFAKASEWDTEEVIEGNKEAIYHEQPYTRYVLYDKDVKLINYLAKHGHWSPYSHPQISLHVKAPIFIARQLGKHQVGLAWNEVSRRYVSYGPEFYIPKEWRKASKDKKQGSSDETIDFIGTEPTTDIVTWNLSKILCLYDTMIHQGVCPEQARMILPQSMYTEWHWTGSLYAFARVYNLRSKPDAQKEVQEIAKQIKDIIEPLFPVSWKALTNEQSNS